jgi:ACS family hexuronate transporter-like MFS transporter
MAFKVKGLRWWITGLLMLVTVVNYLDRSCLSIAAPTLKKSLDIDEQSFAYIIMAFQLSYLVFQPISGRIIDWLNLRKGFSLAIIWYSIAQVLTALATGWRSFAFFRVLLGIGEAGNFPGAIKTISIWFKSKERTLATGIFNTGSSFGAMIAPPLVAFLILKFNWQAAFIVTGCISLVWGGLWLLFYHPPEKHPLITKEELAMIQSKDDGIDVQDVSSEKGVWKVVLPQRNFWGIAGARFLSEPAWQFFTYWIPLYMVAERGWNLKQIGLFLWMPFLAGDLGCIFGGILSPLFIRMNLPLLTARKAAATVSALIMIFAIFIGTAPTPAWAIFFFCVGAFAHQSMSSTLLTLPADLFPKRTVATANGLTGAVGHCGGMLFTFIVGYIALRIGYKPLFVGIAFFDVIGVLFLWFLLKEPKERAVTAMNSAA